LLPPQNVPAHIIVLDSFPIASSGKIDRNALPPPDEEQARRVPFRTPSDDQERELCRIWQEVLKLRKIGIDDNFFELGGSSLQALLVFAQIETRLGCALSPSTILHAPTIARLAEFIRATSSIAGYHRVVPLRASGTGSPLFLVCGRFYFATHYHHLVSAIKNDRPVFGIQPPPLDGKHRLPRTIEAMAANCITEIRRIQPHGPYFLAGHSFGGRVSFEIAQQLVRAGERVSFLGLIDTAFHDALFRLPGVSEALRLSRKVRRVQGLRDLVRRTLRFVTRTLRSIQRRATLRQYDLRVRLAHFLPYEQRVHHYVWLCLRANRRYVPKPYLGHTTMFSSAGNSEQQSAHWGPLAHGGLTVLEVPADHFDMAMPPHSKHLAKHFDACLDAAARRE